MGDDWDLDEASEFLVIAATLLDLKAARLLPAAEVEDEEDLALLEARDLLFARLLQYRAFKEAAAHLAELEAAGARRCPRAVSLEPRYADALPDLVLGIGPERLLKLALKALTPKPAADGVDRAHPPGAGQRPRARRRCCATGCAGPARRRSALLIADCESTLEVVARFLALLELYREGPGRLRAGAGAGRADRPLDRRRRRVGELEVDEYDGTPEHSRPSRQNAEQPSRRRG